MSDEEQALAAFEHAAEELRFFKQQQWMVTNYVALIQAAMFGMTALLHGQRWARGLGASVAITA